jgi:hypothetical protein
MTQAPNLRESVVATYARYLVEKSSDEARVLALFANPAWTGSDQLDLDGARVLVRGCPSSLAVREAFMDVTDGDYLVVLTDQDADALGESITSRFWHQRVELVDPWRSVADLFSAHSVASEVKALGSEFAQALADARPSGGYAVAATGVVTADVAMRGLLTSVLQVAHVDLDVLLVSSGDAEVKASWQQIPAEVRRAVGAWTRDGIGLVAPVILNVLASRTRVDALTVGLAADVLYVSGAPREADQAQVRLEEYFDGHGPDTALGRAFADACTDYVRRLPADDPRRAQFAARAQQLLADVRWPQGARNSLFLPDGHTALAHELAAQLRDDASTGMEAALKDLEQHQQAETQFRAATQRARMAVRLRRWLSVPRPVPATLKEALERQVRVDAWVDLAVADVFTGSSDPVVADAYRHVVSRVRAVRDEHDAQFAALLADSGPGLLGVEDVLERVVLPIATATPVLLIVVDGMSAAVAAELAEGIERRGWTEMMTGTGRLPVLAALPTVTRYSRTSLFAGRLTDGGQADEKAAFGGPLFHKDDLRAPAGEELAPAVRAAVESGERLVGVVLNTVDDALAKADPGGVDWTVETVQHLAALLDLAASVGRTVILTSDHGHVVERGSQREAFPGADARYRPAGELSKGEVLLDGPRVLAHGGRIVAAVSEDLRYGNKAAGYHGGASAAEVTIPLLVFTQAPNDLASTSWRPAVPQAPDWWVAPAEVPVRKSAKKSKPQVVGQESLFVEPEVGGLAEQLGASPLFVERMERVLRQLKISEVLGAVGCLSEAGGRAHRDVVARAAGLPAVRMPRALPIMQRVLNVEGYQVLSMDVDGVTMVLDRGLLAEQFGLDS